jgi:HK97 family phage portal protein
MPSATILDLQARQHQAGTLMSWLAARPGAADRAGVSALGGNASRSNLTLSELAGMLGAGASSQSGMPVTAETAMRVSTVYACVTLITGAISTLPFNIYERPNGGQVDHDYWWMFNEQANEDMTAATAWEYLVAGKLFYGDGFAELLRPSRVSNRVIGWKPHHPLAVNPQRDSQSGQWYWRVQPDRGEAYTLDWADILHLPSLGFEPDTMLSPSPITYAAREAIGTALAGERYHAQFFNGGGTFDYALKTAHALNKEQADVLLASLRARSAGSRSPLILSGGLEPAQLSVDPKDAEILGTRLFTVEEICRIFGVPPHMVGHTEKNSSWGTGMEAQGTNFVRYTLLRHLNPIAQEFNRKLWPVRQRFYVKHDPNELVRGDIKTRYDAYRVALGRAGEQPWMDVSEVRRLERLPGDKPLTPNPTGGAGAQPSDPAAG